MPNEQSVIALFDGATEVLDLLASAAVVVDSSYVLIRASVGAQAFGLIQNRILSDEVLFSLVARVRASGASESIEAAISDGTRNKVWVHARAAKMSGRHVLLLIEDRSEMKRLEDTRRDFVANISHELKTPIGAIGLLAEALIDGIDDPQMVKKFAKNLQRESNRLAELVQDIIELSRLQAAEVSPESRPIALSEVIAEALDRNVVIAENRGIKLAVKTDEPAFVYGDREQLTMAVKNLIENAILYSNENAQVGVGLGIADGMAEIAITDTGPGIPREEQDRIFERFYRVDPSRSRQTGGTGLGLSIVKHVALNHNGEIRLFSQLGLGSTFTLRIPLAPGSRSSMTTSASQVVNNPTFASN